MIGYSVRCTPSTWKHKAMSVSILCTLKSLNFIWCHIWVVCNAMYIMFAVLFLYARFRFRLLLVFCRYNSCCFHVVLIAQRFKTQQGNANKSAEPHGNGDRKDIKFKLVCPNFPRSTPSIRVPLSACMCFCDWLTDWVSEWEWEKAWTSYTTTIAMCI